jgi:phosphate starvation-inducible PhoH-like protein
MLGTETYMKYLERGNIEVAPLAYMRGRTLDDSFIILDEAQNTSREQMKMFLTPLASVRRLLLRVILRRLTCRGTRPAA